jgi:hypothetical protein
MTEHNTLKSNICGSTTLLTNIRWNKTDFNTTGPFTGWCKNKLFPCSFGVNFLDTIKMNCSIHLQAMYSCQYTLWTDKRTTTKKGVLNYKSNLSWELTTVCIATTSGMLWYIRRHMDFLSKVYFKDKHISNCNRN